MAARRAIVLAAGLGSRLRQVSGGKPKLIVPVDGRPLLYYPLAVLHSIGVVEACIVVPPGWGEEAWRIGAGIYGGHGVSVVVNKWTSLGNGVSLLLGLECIGWDRALVSMTDHLYTGVLAERVAVGLTGRGYSVGVDRSPSFIDEDEATRVKTAGGLVVEIGKGLDYYTGVDVGVHAVDALWLYVDMKTNGAFRGIGLSSLVQQIASQGVCYEADVTGLPWTEIDTPRDYYEVLRGRRRIVLEAVKEWLKN